MDPGARLSLKWPRWYPPTADDRQKDAQTLTTLANAGQISRETAVKSIADTYDIEDVAAELARIAADRDTNGKQLMTEADTSAGPEGDPMAELRARAEHSNAVG